MKKMILALSIVALIFLSGCIQTGFDPCAQFHPDSQDKDNCLADYAEQHKDSEICELIYREIIKEGCYHSVAILTNNVELCKKIVSKISASERDICFKTIAINLTDETKCEYMSDRQAKEGCYWDIADLTKNKTICDKISNEKWREECMRDITT